VQKDPGQDGDLVVPFQTWIDAQLPPALAVWLREEHGVSALHVEDLGLLRAPDSEIFSAATQADLPVVLVTKDSDFAALVTSRGVPPQVVWLRCGNVSNSELRRIIDDAWPRAAELLGEGEVLVEIRSRQNVSGIPDGLQ